MERWEEIEKPYSIMEKVNLPQISISINQSNILFQQTYLKHLNIFCS